MNLTTIFDTMFCIRLIQSLGHFLWQGLLFALLAALATSLQGRTSANRRYAIYVATLAIMAACLPVNLLLVNTPGVYSKHADGPPLEAMSLQGSSSPLKPSALAAPRISDAQSTAGDNPNLASTPLQPAGDTPEVSTHTHKTIDWRQYAQYIVFGYLAGVAIMLGRLMLALQGGKRLRRRSQPVEDPALLSALARQSKALGLSLTPMIAYCQQVAVPTVVGVLRPVILLPLSLISELPPDHIEALLAHELAHIRRYDHLINIFQRLIEAALFFHPAVWFISRRIKIERENCCDDLVVLAGAERFNYAASLVQMAELTLIASAANRFVAPVALGAARKPTQLRCRIIRLLEGSERHQVRLGRTWIITTALILILGLTAASSLRKDALAEQPSEKPNIKVPRDMVGTWHFDNPMGDDEQMAIFGDGRVVVLYSNGHQDHTQYANGTIELAEYNHVKFKMSLLPDGSLVQTGISGIGLAKLWQRIDLTPKVELIKPLSGPQEEAHPISLQEQIDRAEAGGVILVPAGKHTGPIRITKPVTLRGKGADVSTIELLGNEPAIFIRGTKDVILENLTVRWGLTSTDARPSEPAAIAVRDGVALVKGCRLEPVDRPKDTPYGLLAAGRSEVTFAQGRTTGFAYTLVFLDGANGVVRDSVLSDAGHSVVTLHANSQVKITNNVLARCDYHAVRNTGGTMEMAGNLVIDNNRAGAYLGNKSAHGTIANNLFIGNRGGIWAYAESDVVIENNIFAQSRDAAVAFRDSCRLQIRNNSIVDNPTGLIRYFNKDKPTGTGAIAKRNHYWNNKKDVVNFDKEASAVTGDPIYANPTQGDYALTKRSPKQLVGGQGQSPIGLTDPKPIRALWAQWPSEDKRRTKK